VPAGAADVVSAGAAPCPVFWQKAMETLVTAISARWTPLGEMRPRVVVIGADVILIF
jgi:hypothetical protein